MTSFESYQFDAFERGIRLYFLQNCMSNVYNWKFFDILMYFSFVISFGNESKAVVDEGTG